MCKKHDDLPSLQTIFNWLKNFPEFVEWYSHAKEQQLAAMAEDIMDIANDDQLEANDKRVRINARQWLLSKLKAKTYGDRLDLTSGGETLSVPTHMIDARVQSIIMSARARRQGEPLQLDAKALKLLE